VKIFLLVVEIKIVPLKPTSILRLELCDTFLAAHLLRRIVNILEKTRFIHGVTPAWFYLR